MDKNEISLKVKIFADGADIDGMIEMAAKPFISGLTTNPTLMARAGIKDYSQFAKDVLNEIPDKPISFEVFSDNLEDMKYQGDKISSWGENVYVKIPITNTKAESTREVIAHLVARGVKVNVTALMSTNQVSQVVAVLNPATASYISVFAGRVADTGRDPVPLMRNSLELMKSNQSSELIWASPRELLNIFQADSIGCHVITATNDILKKLSLFGYDLEAYSLETVKMFFEDARASGYKI
jgi:transaldolase